MSKRFHSTGFVACFAGNDTLIFFIMIVYKATGSNFGYCRQTEIPSLLVVVANIQIVTLGLVWEQTSVQVKKTIVLVFVNLYVFSHCAT